jgi:hypothetical protein
MHDGSLLIQLAICALSLSAKVNFCCCTPARGGGQVWRRGMGADAVEIFMTPAAVCKCAVCPRWCALSLQIGSGGDFNFYKLLSAMKIKGDLYFTAARFICDIQ